METKKTPRGKTRRVNAEETLSKYKLTLITQGEFISVTNRITVACNRCRTNFPATLKYAYAHRCPNCPKKIRVPLRKIMRYLEEREVPFRKDYKLEWHDEKQPLLFDIAVFHQGKLAMLIEYDGEEYDLPMKTKDGEEGFQLRHEVNKHQERICKEMGIPLIRIAFAQRKYIPQILSRYFGHLPVKKKLEMPRYSYEEGGYPE